MNESDRQLVAYIESSISARKVLSEMCGIELDGLDIQNALAEVLQLSGNPPLGLLERRLSSPQIIEMLKGFDFTKYHPECLAVVTLEESVLPPNTPRLLTEQTVKSSGEVWRVHKNDSDPFPSNPHAHNLESGLALHLGTGDLYNRKRQVVAKVGCKELLTIRGKLTGLKLPDTACK